MSEKFYLRSSRNINRIFATLRPVLAGRLLSLIPLNASVPVDESLSCIILSARISAGIDMSLYVVAKLLGKEKAMATTQHMEYNPDLALH